MNDARRLDAWHSLCLYLISLVAYATAAVGASIPFWLLIAFPIALATSHLIYERNLGDAIAQKWWNGLILIAFAAVVIHYLMTPALHVVAAGTRFVLILLAIKLLNRSSPRDELQIYALTFLILAATSEIHEDFTYGVFFAAFVLLGTFGLALFHLKNETQANPHLSGRRRSPFDRLYISTLAAISLLIFISSILIFFVFPRVGLGFFNDPSRSTLPITGFSDQVDVGDHGTIRDNPEVVMRVDFDGQRPGDATSFLWRAMSFDYFDGSGWQRTLSDTRSNLSYSHARRYDVSSRFTSTIRDTFDDDRALHADIYLEPLGSDVLITRWPTDEVRLRDADAPSILSAGSPELDGDDYGDLFHSLPDNVALRYQLSLQPTPSVDLLDRADGASLDDDDRQRYLQLPDISPATADLADQLANDAHTPYAKAQAIADHFQSNFQYSLDLPAVEGEDAVDEFLFDHQYGHCEYFATSAVLMLRHQGVPARLVNGFLGGAWNNVGDYLTVRQGDAHTWVEIYVPDVGWVPVDPTPPIESTFLDRTGLLDRLDDAIDAARRAWSIWFLEYDLDAQIGLFGDLRDYLRGLDTGTSDDDDDQAQAAEGDGIDLSLRQILFIGGWLFLFLLAIHRGRRTPYTRGRTLFLATAAFAGAGGLWAALFQGLTPLWIVAGALSVASGRLTPPLITHYTQPAHTRRARNLFQRIESQARRAGLQRPAHQGADQFLKRLASAYPAIADACLSFRSLYLALRFSPAPPPDDLIKRLTSLSETIIAELRDAPPPDA